ncbi:amidohydrolase family protein [Nonomuraea dietziae]|uniref:amidohydrolase family protein n=1 Tax=Nonomuraea dietziae TaxID=65515 RepID=UPI0031D6E178
MSGLVTEADHEHWTVEDLRPYVEHAVEVFGPDRLMFGSDWPVLLLAADYQTVFTVYSALLGATDRGKVLGGNAARFYGFSEI